MFPVISSADAWRHSEAPGPASAPDRSQGLDEPPTRSLISLNITSPTDTLSRETDHETRGSRKRLRTGFAAIALGVTMLVTAAACMPEDPHGAVDHWWGDLAPCAGRIVQRESGWNPDAVSPGGGNIGLFQLNATHATWIRNELGYTWEQLKEPPKNARAAKVLYNKAQAQYGDGWQPWRLNG